MDLSDGQSATDSQPRLSDCMTQAERAKKYRMKNKLSVTTKNNIRMKKSRLRRDFEVSVIKRDYEVSVMVKTGNYWKWPIKEDKIMYKTEHVLRQIKPPEFRESARSRQFKG